MVLKNYCSGITAFIKKFATVQIKKELSQIRQLTQFA